MIGIVTPSEASASGGTDSLFENLVWMNSEEAATYLRRTPNAIRILICRGKLRRRKWNGRLLFKKIELDLMLESSR